ILVSENNRRYALNICCRRGTARFGRPYGSGLLAEVTVALAVSQLVTGQVSKPVHIGTVRQGCDNDTH
ncbi:MAG: hypothetical protein ABSF03_10155, partial [Streptosporangiaceae bacterium]